jgi:hypothetical protein
MPSISEAENLSHDRWLQYFGQYLAVEIIPRLPLRDREITWDNALGQLLRVLAWLRQPEAFQSASAFSTCFGFVCENCQAGVRPEETICFICSHPTD